MMAREAKSKEELAIINLRCKIIKQMEDCVSENDAHAVVTYASALAQLPIFLDYEE